MMVATLSPETTTDMARPRLVASTSEMAATEATAQNPAYARADTTRMTSRNPKFGTRAAATWAAMKTSWKPISAARRGIFRVARHSRGAPVNMPMAKADTSSPAEERGTSRSWATEGSTSERMNSEVP